MDDEAIGAVSRPHHRAAATALEHIAVVRQRQAPLAALLAVTLGARRFEERLNLLLVIDEFGGWLIVGDTRLPCDERCRHPQPARNGDEDERAGKADIQGSIGHLRLERPHMISGLGARDSGLGARGSATESRLGYGVGLGYGMLECAKEPRAPSPEPRAPSPEPCATGNIGNKTDRLHR